MTLYLPQTSNEHYCVFMWHFNVPKDLNPLKIFQNVEDIVMQFGDYSQSIKWNKRELLLCLFNHKNEHFQCAQSMHCDILKDCE